MEGIATSALSSPELQAIERKLQDAFKKLSNGLVQKMEKLQGDPAKQKRELEALTVQMRNAKSLIREYEVELKTGEGKRPTEANKQLHDKKNAFVKELNGYVSLRKQYVAVHEGQGEAAEAGKASRGVSAMGSEAIIAEGCSTMDATDVALKRTQRVVEDTIHVGAETAVTLKGQTEQMGRIVNELDTIKFSLKRASRLITQMGRQLATDKCIMLMLLACVLAVLAIIIVKITHKHKKLDQLPGFTPISNRRLLWSPQSGP